MNTKLTTSWRRRIAAALATTLIAGSLATPLHAARKPNFGLYVTKYQRVVPTNVDWLEHPTGEYVSVEEHKWKDMRELYSPRIENTDDMDTKVLELHEKGWVMIGYAAFSSAEAPPSPFEGKVNPGEVAGTRLGLRIRGHDPNMDMKGDPTHAAIWANASMVVIQEGYAFSRLETKMARIKTNEGKDTTRMSGGYQGSSRDVYAGRSGGSSSTSGRVDSSGNWDENHQEVSAGYGSTGGSVEGTAGQSEGSNSDKTRYKEDSRFSNSHSGGSAGRYQGSYDDTVTTTSNHWATALIDKHVNHYDYMVTFWKRARVDQFVLGALTETVPRDLMREIGTRHARRIRAVVGGTRANRSAARKATATCSIAIAGARSSSPCGARARSSTCRCSSTIRADRRRRPRLPAVGRRLPLFHERKPR